MNNQRGFSIVTAIFLLVILGMLGAYMVNIFGTQQATSLLTLQGSRAYKAAGSGVQWAVYQAFNNSAVACGGAPSSPVNSSFNLAGTGLNGFSVSVTCSYKRYREKNECFNIFRIDSMAEYGSYGSADYVSRRLQSTITDMSQPLTGCP